MPLSENCKAKLTEFTDNVRNYTKLGPVELIDKILEAENNQPLRKMFGEEVHGQMLVLNQNIRENRKEAEQYLAGLLGMM